MTRDEYNAGLEMITAMDGQNVLLPVLKAGQSPINELYMGQILTKLSNYDPTMVSSGTDVVVVNLEREKANLYGNRAKMSNKFHDCRTDEERAIVSEQVMMIQAEIQAVNRKIKTYNLTGTLSEPKNREIPEDLYECFKLKENARKNIPRIEKALRELFEMPENTPGRSKKIAEKEAKLLELKLFKKNVEKAIQSKTV